MNLNKLIPGAMMIIALHLTATPSMAYEVTGGEIKDSKGNTLQLKGLNWFGFETGDHVAHGLWTRTSINTSVNADLVGLNSLQVLDLVVNEFDRQGFYVLLDHHRLDCNGSISELWYSGSYSEQRWISDLTFMAGRYKTLDHFLGIDLKNEPHGSA
ncbi:MAG: endoglucanase, partial [Gammaproteobacteria bacterium]|nr:endoglucanase [Gammaproteobacteria bacterium]